MPLNLTPLSLDHKPEIDALLRQYPPMISEISFTNLFIWRYYYQFQVASDRGFITLLAQPLGANPFFFPPIGKGDTQSWVFDSLNFFKSQGVSPCFERIPQSIISELSGFSELQVVADRDNSDYVYRTDNLVRLSGNKYHTLKNHINRFNKKYAWEYLPLTPNFMEECLILQDEWCRSKKCIDSHHLLNEDKAINEALKKISLLSYKGGVIRINQKVEAFTLGELLNPETVVIHIEKANPEFPGLYPILQQQFLEREWSLIPFVNREQDLGIEGLRKSKLSYHPEFMVDKFRLIPK
ncbi:MAG: DUF2156 domain-containing protein [Deltaproteobacteria bacterium]|nr:DUF2156 domain-containing protein [Deltaproteobacteria bacterium]